MQTPDRQPQPRAPISDEADRPNSLGLRSRELGTVLDQLDDPGDAERPKPRREFVRWPYRHASVTLQVVHPGGTSVTMTVACRNVSRGGMSVLHRAYVHTGARCTVRLPRAGLEPLCIEGHIVRCGHRFGLIHEIGIRFAHPIDVRTLLRPAPFADCFSLERIHPESLTGTVVCVDPSESDQAIVRHFLRPTKVRLRPAASIAEAVPLLRDGCDVLLGEFQLPDGTAADLIGLARHVGFAGPVLIATADTGPAMCQRLAGLDAAASLAKPLGQRTLLRAIAEFVLLQDDRSGPARDEQLAGASLNALRQYAAKLESAIDRDDAAVCCTLCGQILGTAPAAGQHAIAALASKAGASLRRTMSVTQSINDIRALAAACRHAGLPAAA